MTRRILLILLVLPLIVPFSRSVAANPEPTAQEIIAKLLAARGGADRVKAVTSLKLKGKIISADGGEFPLTAYHKAPNKLRYEVILPLIGRVFGFDGKEGWKKPLPLSVPSNGPVTVEVVREAMPPEKMGRGETRDIRDEADFNRFNPGFNLDALPAGSLQVLPTQTFEGIPCHVLKVTGGDTIDRYYFIEVPTGELVKIGDKPDPKSNGTLLSDYREVNGVRFPFNIEIVNKGNTVQQTLVEKIEVNPKFQDDLFAFPKEKPKKS